MKTKLGHQIVTHAPRRKRSCTILVHTRVRARTRSVVGGSRVRDFFAFPSVNRCCSYGDVANETVRSSCATYTSYPNRCRRSSFHMFSQTFVPAVFASAVVQNGCGTRSANRRVHKQIENVGSGFLVAHFHTILTQSIYHFSCINTYFIISLNFGLNP